MHRKNANLKVRDFQLSVKAEDVSDDGTFTGYGSVFGVVDTYGEVVAKGAFSKSLDEIAKRGRPVPALWQHRSDSPIGTYDLLKEDDRGLYVKGRLLTQAVPKAAEAHALLKAGAVSGLSIGYYVRDDSFDEKTRVRTLKEVDLVEVSLVTFPANDDARVDAIKMKLAHGSMPTIREFEQLLREAGFSKSQAAVIANRGLKHLLDRGEPESGIGEVAAALSAFSLPSL